MLLDVRRSGTTKDGVARDVLGMRGILGLIGEEKVSLRKSELYLGYLLFSREMLNRYMMVKLLQSELSASASNEAAPSAA